MKQTQKTSDETIFQIFENAMNIHIQLEQFVLSKTVEKKRKRSTTTIIASSYTKSTWVDCKAGWGRVLQKCVRCPSGYRSASNTRYPCVICPGGTYSESAALETCTNCPAGLSTPSDGTTTKDDCAKLCTIPVVVNGTTTPAAMFNVTDDVDINIKCKNDMFDLEFNVYGPFKCAAELPKCYKKCVVGELPANQVLLNPLKVNATVLYKEKVVLVCSDQSQVAGDCGEDGVITLPQCGSEVSKSTPAYIWVVVAVAISGVVVAVVFIMGMSVIKKKREMEDRASTDVSRSVALATNIDAGQAKVVLSRPFDSKAFLLHVQVQLLILNCLQCAYSVLTPSFLSVSSINISGEQKIKIPFLTGLFGEQQR